MNYLKRITAGLWHEEDGVSATEYAVMLAVITLTCVISIGLMGEAVSLTFTTITNALPF